MSVAESADVTGPATLGAIAPLIALPPRFLDEISEEQASSTLAHELAHVARRDF